MGDGDTNPPPLRPELVRHHEAFGGELPPWLWPPELLRLRRIDDSEIYFATSQGALWWALLVLAAFTAFQIFAFSLGSDSWISLLLMGPPALFLLVLSLRRSDLRIDLENSKYCRRRGFWPRPATWIEGPIDDLKELRFRTSWYDILRDHLSYLWIELAFRTFTVKVRWGDGRVVASDREGTLYRELYVLAEALRVDVVDQTGERMAWNQLRRNVVEKRRPNEEPAPTPRTSAGVAIADDSAVEPDASEPAPLAPYRARLKPPPSGSGFETHGGPGRRWILLPSTGLFEGRNGSATVLAVAGSLQGLWLLAPIGPVLMRIAVAMVCVVALTLFLLGNWRRPRIEQHGHYLRLSSDILGINRHHGFLHRDGVYDLHVRRPMLGSNTAVLPGDRALAVRTERGVIYLGQNLPPEGLEWLRVTLLEMLKEMRER